MAHSLTLEVSWKGEPQPYPTLSTILTCWLSQYDPGWGHHTSFQRMEFVGLGAPNKWSMMCNAIPYVDGPKALVLHLKPIPLRFVGGVVKEVGD